MKAVVKFIQFYMPAMSRLVTLHQRGTIKLVPMSHREVRANGPQFVWKNCLWDVSWSGEIRPLKIRGRNYNPAEHEDGISPSWSEYAKKQLGF